MYLTHLPDSPKDASTNECGYRWLPVLSFMLVGEGMLVAGGCFWHNFFYYEQFDIHLVPTTFIVLSEYAILLENVQFSAE